MNILIAFIVIYGELIAAGIFIYEAYIIARWLAEHIVEPLFWKVHDFLPGFYIFQENEQWLMWHKEDDGG